MWSKAIVFWAISAITAGAGGIEVTINGQASGTVKIDLLEDVAPLHAERITHLANEGFYDGVAFHRVIPGFMAQTGDGQYGKIDSYNGSYAGSGSSQYPDLPQEFSAIPFDRGVVGMARSQNPNSANSQFFIMFEPGHFLNGNYTVVGRVTEGMDIIDTIKAGTSGNNGAVAGTPDVMARVIVTE